MAVERAVTGRGGGGAPRDAIVRPAPRLRGELRLPGDKSISHRALILATLAQGESRIAGAGNGADVRSTAAICRALGAQLERVGERDGNVDYDVSSPGPDGLAEPAGILDCANSGTSLRLVAGVVAGLPMYVVLDGDDSLRRRPVARIIEPLRLMGAVLHGRRNDSLPPLTVVGHTPLRAIRVATTVPSAQTKSAILLAALRAAGRTTVTETVATRDHTERMLRARGVPVASEDAGGGAARGAVAVSLEGGMRVQAMDDRVPGDISAAAFWLVAGSIHPDAELRLREVGVNPTRRAVLDLLRAMGARIDERPARSAVDEPAVGEPAVGEPALGEPALGDEDACEPVADLVVRSSELRGIDLSPAEVASAIDEIPILCLAATQAHGVTTIRGASELRTKESDRIAGTAAGLSALGARVEVTGDDLRIVGPTRLRGAATDSLDDHRLAMMFAIAGLLASGETTITRPASASISYPAFFADLERMRA